MSWSMWWIPLALFALSTPTAAVQVEGPTLDVIATPHGAPIEPIKGAGEASVDVSITCKQAAVYQHMNALVVTVAVETGKDWLTTALDKHSVIFDLSPADCAAGTKMNETVSVSLFVDKDAPALDTSFVTVTATPANGTAVTRSWNETAGVFLDMKAKFDHSIQRAKAGEQVAYPLILTNEGNGPVRTQFTLNDNTSEELEVQFPEEIEVPAGQDRTVNVTATAPSGGWKAEVGTFHLILDFTAVDDTSLVGQARVSALVQGNLFSEESPVPSFVSVLIVLAALALLHRRRR